MSIPNAAAAEKKKIIAVIGATGHQGEPLVRAILSDGQFAVRAITRDPGSEKAKLLRMLGAEIARATVTDVQSLSMALSSCYGLFCMTYTDHKTWDPEVEREQGRSMSQAAKQAGIKHVVWSTLDDSRKLCPLDDDRMPTVREKYKVPHFDVKAEIDQMFIEKAVPTTFLMPGAFWDTILENSVEQGPNDTLAMSLPLTKKGSHIVGLAVEDVGKCALGIFKRPKDFIGKRIGIASEALTLEQMAEKLSTRLNKRVVAYNISIDAYRRFGFPGAVELANMFQLCSEFETQFINTRNMAESRKLNPGLMTFDEWLAKNADKLRKNIMMANSRR